MMRAAALLVLFALPACTERDTSDADGCAEIKASVDAFLEDHRTCRAREDCVFLGSECRVDDCSGVAVNREASSEEWTALDRQLGACSVEGNGECNYVGECAFEIECSPQGRCEPAR